jgi:hypothetical protein
LRRLAYLARQAAFQRLLPSRIGAITPEEVRFLALLPWAPVYRFNRIRQPMVLRSDWKRLRQRQLSLAAIPIGGFQQTAPLQSFRSWQNSPSAKRPNFSRFGDHRQVLQAVVRSNGDDPASLAYFKRHTQVRPLSAGGCPDGQVPRVVPIA